MLDNTKRKKRCKKVTSFPCGATCLPRRLPGASNDSECSDILRGQAKTYVDWLALVQERVAKTGNKRREKGKASIYLTKKGRLGIEGRGRLKRPQPELATIALTKATNEAKADRDLKRREFDYLSDKVNSGFILKRLFNRIRFGGKIKRGKAAEELADRKYIELDSRRAEAFDLKEWAESHSPGLLKSPRKFNEALESGKLAELKRKLIENEFVSNLKKGKLPVWETGVEVEENQVRWHLKKERGMSDSEISTFIENHEKQTSKITNSDDTQIFLAVGEDGLLGSLRSGGYKNMFEREERGGEAIGEIMSYTQARLDTEEYAMNIPPEISGKHRPKYGYVGSRSAIYGGELQAEHKKVGAYYGEARIEFKPEVKKRATISLGDTMDDSDFVPTPMLAPKIASFSARIDEGFVDSPSSVSDLRGQFNYIEAQIYGSASVSDMQAIHIPSNLKWKKFDDIVEIAKQNNIPVYRDGRRVA